MLLREASDKRFQVDALDGLRGLAVLIVICSHTSNIQWYFLPGLDLRGVGKIGVYLFFLLSAYLLTLPLLHKGSSILSRPVLWHYAQRRFWRIYPIFFLYLVFAACTTWLIHRSLGPEHQGIPFSLTTQEFFKHLLLWDCKGVTWSIAAEFKFYFVLPLLAAGFYWLDKRHVALALGAGVALVIAQILLAPYWAPLHNFQSFWVYLPIFIPGMLLALMQKKIYACGGLSSRWQQAAKLLAALGIAAILLMTPSAMSLLGKDVSKEYFHEFYFSYGIAWMAVLFAALNTRGLLTQLLCSSPLRFLGAISFSLYLFHPIPIFVLQLLKISTPFNAWIVLLSASIAAYLSGRYIEFPLSRIKL